MNSLEDCQQKFGFSQKFNASVMVGLITMIVFLIFSSQSAYKLTNDNLKLNTYVDESNGQTPTTNGKWIHSVVAGLIAVLISFIIMEPWKKAMCTNSEK